VSSRVDPRVRVAEQVAVFRRRLRFPSFWLVLLFLSASTSVWLLVARWGSTGGRVAGASGIAISFLGVAIWSLLDGRRWRRPEVALGRIWHIVDREQAARAVRAYGLLEQTEQRPASGSPELAKLHLSRVLDGLSEGGLKRALSRRVRRLAWLAFGLSVFLLGLWLGRGLPIVEGGLVLGATRGVARLRLPYLTDTQVLAEGPSYLQEEGKARLLYGDSASVPQGSVITFRILPRALARQWVLRDGMREEPFVSEGSGTWVARLTVTDPVDLRVGARHGDVVILDPFEMHVETTVDRPPSVVLDHAPRDVALEELERLELDYVAYDDHGLVQIELVIETGGRVQRTELARFDGKQRNYRGGHAIERNHPLLARAFLPVRVHVEARDADSVTGPHWGKSQVITLLPPALGADGAKRYLAFKEFRALLVSALATEIGSARVEAGDALLARQKWREALTPALAALKKTLTALPDPPQGSLRFLEAQVETLTDPASSPSTLESVVLATDVLLRNWSKSQAEDTAEDLAQALDEVAVGARQRRESAESGADQRLVDQLALAQQGALELRKIGVLGADLGSVAQADLGRALSAFEEKSYDRLERVAVHLAARLRRGTPSFGSRGSAGVESGTPSSGGEPGEGEGSESGAPGAYDELAQKAKELANDHARSLSELDQLLNEAARAAQADRGRDPRWQKEAEALRRALAGLPEVGAAPGTASSEAALGKNQGEAMADALEAADLGAALARGRDARAAIERAQRIARERGSSLDPTKLEASKSQIERALREAASAESNAARDPNRLAEAAARERALADQTEKLGRDAKGGVAPLPRAAREALERAGRQMRAAADAMAEGRGDEGRRLAEDAQRELERAQPESSGGKQAEAGSPAEGDEAQRFQSHGEVPGERKDRGRRFRERVQRGLGQPSGTLSPAVERYAEGLQ